MLFIGDLLIQLTVEEAGQEHREVIEDNEGPKGMKSECSEKLLDLISYVWSFQFDRRLQLIIIEVLFQICFRIYSQA